MTIGVGRYHFSFTPPSKMRPLWQRSMDEVLAWQRRPLEPMYPVVFFDALRVKIRADGLHLIRSSLDYANWKDRKVLALCPLR